MISGCKRQGQHTRDPVASRLTMYKEQRVIHVAVVVRGTNKTSTNVGQVRLCCVSEEYVLEPHWAGNDGETKTGRGNEGHACGPTSSLINNNMLVTNLWECSAEEGRQHSTRRLEDDRELKV